MKRWFYFYNLNGLMIRVLTARTLLWISYGHRAEWQFKIQLFWWWTWPKPEHRLAIYSFGFLSVLHTRR